MLLQSNLSQDEYLNALKKDMGPFFALGTERFTGFTIGGWFYVTHHAGVEWHRRITNQKNAALGYVKDIPGGSQVRFISFKGLLCPGQFLFACILATIIAALFLLLTHDLTADIITVIIGTCAVVTIISAPIQAFQESLTERSCIGKKCLLALLQDPSYPLDYFTHKTKLH